MIKWKSELNFQKISRKMFFSSNVVQQRINCFRLFAILFLFKYISVYVEKHIVGSSKKKVIRLASDGLRLIMQDVWGPLNQQFEKHRENKIERKATTQSICKQKYWNIHSISWNETFSTHSFFQTMSVLWRQHILFMLSIRAHYIYGEYWNECLRCGWVVHSIFISGY